MKGAEDYIFLDCVKESLAQQVGCRLPWDKKTNQHREVCSKKGQFQKFDFLSMSISIEEIEQVKLMTGCLAPCSYKVYKFMFSHPKDMALTDVPDDEIAIGLWPASRITEFREEVS